MFHLGFNDQTQQLSRYCSYWTDYILMQNTVIEWGEPNLIN